MLLNPNCKITEFNEFVKNHTHGHYMKTSMWVNTLDANTKPFYVGFYEEDKLIGTALVLKKKWLNKSYLYIPWGPCIDYQNQTQLKETLNLLKTFTKNENCFMLRIDFNVIRVSRDLDGNEIEGINNEHITDTIIDCGFKHKGYGYAYNGSWVNRYTLVASLNKTIDEILASYAKPRQTAIKRHQIIGVQTRIGTLDDLDALCSFEKELAELQGFKPHSKEYFKKIIESFKQNARFYVTEIDLARMVQGLDEEIHSKKYAKDKEAYASKEKEYKEALQLQKTYGDHVKIAAGLFLYYGDTSYDLYTYNKKEFGFVKPVDNLHFFAMQDMKNLGVTHYDMCGFSGTVKKEDPYYGLYSYKKSFGSEFTEYIGEFDYIQSPKAYQNFIKQYRLYSKVKRKVNAILNQKQKSS
ncbi:lipid II:glycine glycyltransferase FemX [Anaerorhabdus sp.]|uniref:lipid II:glycine glycyltransferase FemX n=1 Tax=Anaerorhabdus sp. TaxID=1872524 RepID=UPI002FC7ADA5